MDNTHSHVSRSLTTIKKRRFLIGAWFCYGGGLLCGFLAMRTLQEVFIIIDIVLFPLAFLFVGLNEAEKVKQKRLREPS